MQPIKMEMAMDTFCKRIRGFTLLEMAIGMIIVGLLVASLSPLYALQRKEERLEQTSVNVQSAVSALAGFRSVNGRYPCPASLSIAAGDPRYGRELFCDEADVLNETIAVGTCDSGVCVQQSTEDITYTSGGTSVTGKVRVRVGAIPFRQLNMDEDESLDAYGNRLQYIVTERLTQDNMFDASAGGISIVNQQDVSAITPPGSAHFTVISFGENGNGAYTRAGVRLECALGSFQGQNCDVNCVANADGSSTCGVVDDAVYRVSQLNSNVASDEFDDIVSYFMEDEVPLWQLSENNQAHMHLKSLGVLGVGVTQSYDLTDQNLIAGSMRLQDDDATPGADESEGRAFTTQLCSADGTGCWPSSKIAGNLADGGGMACPAGQYMYGIAFGQPLCKEEVVFRCPPGSIMKGVNVETGELECSEPPEPGCAAQEFGICGTSKWLSAAPHNSWRTITAGDSREEYYYCDAGNWEYRGADGLCTCTPEVISERTVSCGTGYTGDRVVTVERICPSGEEERSVDRSQCVCQPTTETRPVSCPSGLDGERILERRFTCRDNGTGYWTDWTEVSSNCTCTEDRQTRTLQCSGGLSGEIRQERVRQCPSGNWSGWSDIQNDCRCETRKDQDTRSCPAGFTGNIVVESTFQCPSATWSAWQEVSNNCEEVPSRVCYWNTQGAASGPATEFGLGPRTNDICECGDVGPCHKRLGQGSNLNYSSCVCD